MTKKEAIEYLKKVHDGEEVFIFRAQDRFAPLTIRFWADLVKSQRGLDKKVAEAINCAHEMDRFALTNPTKFPD